MISATCFSIIPTVIHWSMFHSWEIFHLKYGKISHYFCTHYRNVNDMSSNMLHWEIHTSSFKLNQSKTRPPASCWIGLTFMRSVWIFQCNMFELMALYQFSKCGHNFSAIFKRGGTLGFQYMWCKFLFSIWIIHSFQ